MIGARSLFGSLSATVHRFRKELPIAAAEQAGRATLTGPSNVWHEVQAAACLASYSRLPRSHPSLTVSLSPESRLTATASCSFASQPQAAQPTTATHKPSSRRDARSGKQASASRADAPPEASALSKKPKRATLPPGMAQPMQLKMAMVSPNMLAEPYTGEPGSLTWLSLLTITGWRERWNRILSSAKSIYTLAKCKRYLRPFEVQRFKAEALSLYERACTGIARGDAGALRQLATPTEHSLMKQQIRSREEGGWAKTVWALAERPRPSDLEMVRARLIMVDPKDETSGFAQITLRIRSRHKFAAYTSKGHLAAGSADAAVPVQDVWVFERSLRSKDPVSCWRVAGRLSLPPQEPAQRGILFRAFQSVFGRRKH